MRLKSIHLLLGISLIFTTLGGCGYKDIDKRAFVVTIGVDKAKNAKEKYLISAKIAIPGNDPKTVEDQFVIYMSEARTIADGIRKIKAQSDKELDFAHAKAIIFGMDLMKEDIRHPLDWFVRRRDIQMIAWTAIGVPTAEQVIQLKPATEKLPSNSLFFSFGNVGVESQYTISQYLYELYARITEKGMSPILPVIKAQKTHFLIDQAAIFGNNKVKIVLTPKETKLLNIMMRGLSKFELKINDGSQILILSGEQSDADYSIRNVNGLPSLDMNIKISGVVEEKTKLEVLTKKSLDAASRAGERELEKQATKLLGKLQKNNVDPIGFGLRYRSRHWEDDKTEWEAWQSIYSNINFHVKASIDIKSPGVIK